MLNAGYVHECHNAQATLIFSESTAPEGRALSFEVKGQQWNFLDPLIHVYEEVPGNGAFVMVEKPTSASLSVNFFISRPEYPQESITYPITLEFWDGQAERAYFMECTAYPENYIGLGNPKEVMDAAQKGLEPDYIAVLMNELLIKLKKFSEAKRIHDPKEHLALALSYYELLSFVMGGARDNAAYTPCKRHIPSWYGQTILYKNACSMMKARQIFFRLFKLETLAIPLVKTAYHEGSLEPCLMLMENAKARIPKNASCEEAYRLSEWRALNYLNAHFFDDTNTLGLLENLYNAAIEALSDEVEQNPFTKPAHWFQIRAQLISQLEPDARQFLEPLLEVLPVPTKDELY